MKISEEDNLRAYSRRAASIQKKQFALIHILEDTLGMNVKNKVKKRMEDSYEIKITPIGSGYEGKSDYNINNWDYSTPWIPNDNDCNNGEGPYHPDVGKRVVLTRSIDVDGWTVKKGIKGFVRKAYPQKERIYEDLRDTVKHITRAGYRVEISFTEYVTKTLLLDPDAFAFI